MMKLILLHRNKIGVGLAAANNRTYFISSVIAKRYKLFGNLKLQNV